MLKLHSGQFSEKRSVVRQPIMRSAKMYSPLTRRYYPAQTIDLSSQGAMIMVSSMRSLLPGDSIELAIAWDERRVIPHATMMTAEVTRVAGRMGERQVVGIRFTGELRLQEAA